MTPAEAVVGLAMGIAGFIVVIIIAVGWAISRRRDPADDDDPRWGD